MGPDNAVTVTAADSDKFYPVNVKDTQPAGSPPPKPSKQEIGKMKRQYLTQVQGEVVACGHKFDPQRDPRNNCPDCWRAFFQLQTGVTDGCRAIVRAFGKEQLTKVRGSKFAKYFNIFEMETANETAITSAA